MAGIRAKWCDLSCEHATFSGAEDTAGACRRDIVLFCRKHGKFVRKNAFCIDVTRELRAKDPEYRRLFGKGG
ncbi:MAG: hypothetical protein ACTSU5_17250 [Promethearchaeota archaeon]